MELSEVVNPHFAIPVVAVIVCAFLVLAFGFKSPVQPPSFDFEHEERRGKRNKKKQKAVSNGHAVSVEGNHSNVVIKQPTSSVKQSPSTRRTHEKDSKTELSKLKTKKSSVTTTVTKTSAKLSSPKETTQNVLKAEDSGEWTTAVSRKGKDRNKQRNNRKEEKEENWDDDESSWAMTTPVITFTQTKGQNKKDKEQDMKKEDLSDKENLQPEMTDEIAPTKSAKKKKTKKPVVPPTPEPEFIICEPDMTPVVEPSYEPEPAPEATPEATPEPAPEPVLEPVMELAPPVETESIIESENLFPVIETKQEITPRRNKKKRHQIKEVPNEPAAVEIPPPMEIPPPIESLATSGGGERPGSEDSKAISSSDVQLETDNKPAVIFDELGAESWVDAKAIKKKKKARRDN